MTPGEILAQEKTEQRIWYGCYDESWRGLITPESFAHPAKFSLALIKRIYEYMLSQGYIQPGATVLDPFGGMGGGAVANFYGLNWAGCELEQKFHDMGQGCDCTGISPEEWRELNEQFKPDTIGQLSYTAGRHWCPACIAGAIQIKANGLNSNRQPGLFDTAEDSRLPVGFRLTEGGAPYSLPHHYTGNLELFRKYAQPGTFAVLLKGDSRYLRQVIGQAEIEGLLSSPPYAGSRIVQEGGDDAANIRRQSASGRYGATEGQLGAMAEGRMGGLLSSPPYANNTVNPHGIDKGKIKSAYGPNSQALTMDGYGDSDGQLSNLPTGDFEGLLASPPYANGEKGHPSLGSINKDNWGQDGRDIAGRRGLDGNYGESSGQLANMPLGDGLITSSPFAGNSGGRGEASRNGINSALFDRHSGGMKRGTGENPDNLDHLPMKGFEEVLNGGLDTLLSSPPFSPPGNNPTGQGQGVTSDYREGKRKAATKQSTFGEESGQLGAMPMVGFDASLASPPFADSVGSDDPDKRGGLFRDEKRRNDKNLTGTYGASEGQLGAMNGAGFEGVVTSPPFENQLPSHDNFIPPHDSRLRLNTTYKTGYGENAGQLGIEQGQTFWQAARLIVSESFLALKPGAYTAWVCKKFVRNGQIVDFPGQWQQLCETCGFEYVETIRAMLVSPEAQQGDLSGGAKVLRKERKSFFRRLAEKNGSPRIDFEEIVILRKPVYPQEAGVELAAN